MTVMPTAVETRWIVIRTLQELGARISSPFDLDETPRIERGRIVARTYRVDRLMAMWLVEVGIIQFYDEDGTMLRTVNLFEELAPVRLAA